MHSSLEASTSTACSSKLTDDEDDYDDDEYEECSELYAKAPGTESTEKLVSNYILNLLFIFKAFFNKCIRVMWKSNTWIR